MISRARARPAAVITGVILAAFFAGEVAAIASGVTGPFLDESIYITAGRRTLEGFGSSDYYLTWFAGSLLWPTLAGAASVIAGLEGARILAAVCVTVALVATIRAASGLFDDEVRPWVAALGAGNGAVIALAHLAVYDTLALAALGIALCAVVELWRSDHRKWLVVAAVALAVAGLAKYPMLAFGGLPLAVLLAGLRGRRAFLDLLLLGLVVVALLLIFFLQERDQLARFLDFRLEANPSFGVTRMMIGYQLVYFLGIPLVLAVAGLLRAPHRGPLGAALATSLVTPLAYHLGVGTPVGADKHVVAILLFALPPAGFAMARGWRSGRVRRPALIAGMACLAAFGVLQTYRIDGSWPDLRPSIAYLQEEVRPGDRLLVDNSWPVAEWLYEDDRIRSPFDVYDVYRVEHGQAPVSLCDFEWYVESPGGAAWPESIRRRVRECGTFKRVYTRREPDRIGFGQNLDFFAFASTVTIFHNAKYGGPRG